MLAYISLSGCSLLQTTDNGESSAPVPLLAPTGPKRRIVQEINTQWPGRKETLLCVLELDKHRIAIAGVTPQGMSLFNLQYDGNTVKMTKSPLLPDKLPPEMIVKDLQLAYWPLPMLRRLPKPWKIAMPKGKPKQRQLYFNDELVAEVSYLQQDSNWPKSVELTNHRYRYTLHINTVSYDVIPE